MKTCSKCHTEKPTDQFYPNKKNKDGLHSYCRGCNALYKRKWRADNHDHEREYNRKWRADNPDYMSKYHRKYYAENAEQLLEYKRERRAANPEKMAARNTLNNAIRGGKISRPDHCSQCGKQCTPDGHHHSYDPQHWLDVVWLCKVCHMRLHAELDRMEA